MNYEKYYKLIKEQSEIFDKSQNCKVGQTWDYHLFPVIKNACMLADKYGANKTNENGLVKYSTTYDKTIILKAEAITPNTANINIDHINATSSNTEQIPNVTSVGDGIFAINAKKDEDGFCRADGNDHALNASEYSWTPLLPRIKRWKDFKER